MTLPQENILWLEEVSEAILSAVHIAEAEYGSLSAEAKKNIHKYAAMFAARNRGITGKEDRAGMARYAAQQRVRDAKVKPEIVSRYEINFMLSYLDSHVYLELISLPQHDELMRAIISDYDFLSDV